MVLGAFGGLAIVWVAGAVALLLPGQTQLRRSAQESLLVRRLDSFAKPRRLLDALARVDPLPSVIGPVAIVPAPDPSLLRRPGVRAAAPSVVRVVGTARGLSVEGSGLGGAAGDGRHGRTRRRGRARHGGRDGRLADAAPGDCDRLRLAKPRRRSPPARP